MRLLRLDLEQYGAFEGRSLVFRPNARIHVVFGLNEAGKSSALAAVSDLLFGFGQKTDFAFRHDMKDLRLGATIAAADGREVAFRRRKGSKATLVGPDDAPLKDDVLAPFLGALTREVFERAFGLSAESLRRGVADLLASDGETGASLFAAASGLRGVEDLRRSLEAEADALFSPQARTKPFNDIARRYDAARKSLNDLELGASAWKTLNDGIEALAESHRALGERRAAARTGRARLERLARAHGAAAEADRARLALEAFGEAPKLSAEAAAALGERLDAAEAAAASGARAAEALRRAEEDCAAVTVDRPALDAAVEIERLLAESGAHAKSEIDLPRVRRDAESLEDALGRLATRLGLGDASDIEPAMPTDAARAALKELIDEGRRLAQDEERRAQDIAGERERLAALEAERAAAPATPDPGPLREALAALGPRLKPLDRRDELRAEHDDEAGALAEAAARLSPPVGDLGDLAARPLPGAEAIARARKEHDGLLAEIARAEEALARETAEASRVEGELARLACGPPIASPEAIGAARLARDAAWRPLRAHLLGEAALDAKGRADGVTAFDSRAAEADRLADRAAEDAGRAAREAELLRRRAELAAAIDGLAIGLVEINATLAAALDGWREAWAPAGVAPGPPEDMEAWRKAVLALIERRDRNGARAAAIERLDAADRALRPELASFAASAGVGEADGLGSLALSARLSARLAALSGRWEEASRLAARIGDVERRLEALARDEETVSRRMAEWRSRWSLTLPVFGLPESASLATAEAALAAWREAPAMLAERAGLAQRIRGMKRDAERFHDGVGTLVASFAGDLSDLPPEAAARRLNERLTVARAAEARRAETARRLDAARLADEDARRVADEASAAVAAAAIGLPPDADLRLLLGRIEARAGLAARLAERRARLLEIGETADEDALRAELETFDPDAALAAIENLEADEHRLVDERERVFAELARESRRRDDLGGAGAERAAAEQRAAGAALAATARDWAVLKVASLMVGAAVERARAADRSPTLDRAAVLFETLTDGAFSGFSEDYDRDVPTLVGRRASGEKVPVSGLSEGTRDQFYLALRLASLEDYASRAEPAPFIGDDLFASFDDARTAHGLKALAEIGARVQPILFTHHRALVETARRALGGDADIVELSP